MQEDCNFFSKRITNKKRGLASPLFLFILDRKIRFRQRRIKVHHSYKFGKARYILRNDSYLGYNEAAKDGSATQKLDLLQSRLI